MLTLTTIKYSTRCLYWIFISLGCVFLLTGCSGDGGALGGAAQILGNLQKTYNAIANLVISIAYLAGAAFVMKGLFAFKVYGEQRTMMSSQVSIKVPTAYLIAGIGLLWLPEMVSLATNSIFLDPEVKLIQYNAAASDWTKIKNSVFASIQIMGLIAIMRAFFLATVHQPPGGGGGQGGLAKAALHFAGGLAALNIDKMVGIMHDIFVA